MQPTWMGMGMRVASSVRCAMVVTGVKDEELKRAVAAVGYACKSGRVKLATEVLQHLRAAFDRGFHSYLVGGRGATEDQVVEYAREHVIDMLKTLGVQS